MSRKWQRRFIRILTYDIVKGETRTVERPDILIFEGINVLQSRDLPKAGMSVPFISDFFDFSIYIDADERDIERWYVERFMRLRQTAFTNPKSFFHRYSDLSEDAGYAIAQGLVGQYQPDQPASEHLADPAARRSCPAQGPGSSDRTCGAAQIVITYWVATLVTRLKVRLIRPPFFRSVDVSG